MNSHETHATANAGRALLTVNDVKALLAISRSTVYELTAKGELEAVRVGERLRYRPEAIEKYLDRRRVEVRP